MVRGFLAEVLHAVISPFFLEDVYLEKHVLNCSFVSLKDMSRKRTSPFFFLLFFISSYSMQQIDGPPQCMIIQDKQTLVLPHEPKFLTSGNKEMCQQSDSNSASLQCGNTGVYIKPECVCSFYNVYEGNYHTHSSCPGEEKSDDVRLLTCKDCMKYSIPNKGPCINGGNLTCAETGPDVLAPRIKCKCPSGFTGMFCENKMEKVTRICDRVKYSPSLDHLKNCDITKMDCITYSEKKHYVFKCNETTATTNQGQVKLPLCNATESYHTSMVTTMASVVINRGGLSPSHSVSGAGAGTSTFSLILFNIYTLRLICGGIHLNL